MTALNTLSGGVLQVTVGGTGTLAAEGADYQALSNPVSIQKKATFANSKANNAAGGADEMISLIYSISASSSQSIDLTSLTDILNQTGISLARVKGILIRLLSTTDDSTHGTAATSITIDNTVTNALSAQSHSGWFDNGSEGGVGGSKFTVANGDFMCWGTTGAAGVLVDGTHKIIKIVNNDAGVAAGVQVTLFGGTT